MLWDSYMLIKVIIHTTSFLSPSSLSSFIPSSHFFYFCVVILFKRCCDLFISLLPLIIVILCSLLHPLSLSFHLLGGAGDSTTISYLSEALKNSGTNDIVQHGACLGVGLAAMATGDEVSQ